MSTSLVLIWTCFDINWKYYAPCRCDILCKNLQIGVEISSYDQLQYPFSHLMQLKSDVWCHLLKPAIRIPAEFVWNMRLLMSYQNIIQQLPLNFNAYYGTNCAVFLNRGGLSFTMICVSTITRRMQHFANGSVSAKTTWYEIRSFLLCRKYHGPPARVQRHAINFKICVSHVILARIFFLVKTTTFYITSEQVNWQWAIPPVSGGLDYA